MIRSVVVGVGIVAGMAAVSPVSAQESGPDVFEAKAVRTVVGPSSRSSAMPLAATITLSRKPPAGLAAQKGSVDPWFGTFDAYDRQVALMVAASAAGKRLPNLLCIDVDGDGKFSADESVTLEAVERSRRGINYVSAKTDAWKLSSDGKTVTVFLRFQRTADADPIVDITYGDQLEGAIDYGGEQRVVSVLDGNHDGDFDDPTDLWAFGRTAGGQRATQFSMHARSEHRFEDGWDLSLAIDGMTLRVEVADVKAPRPADLVSHRERVERLWRERLDRERSDFVRTRRLDTTRPATQTPIQWHYCTFEEGRELAKQAGKPMFVDVMAFWCVWCYRLDYYTYSDREVAAYLSANFVPVKIVQEQNYVGDYNRVRGLLDANEVPAMGVFDASGKILHKVGGWMPPADFLRELKAVKLGG